MYSYTTNATIYGLIALFLFLYYILLLISNHFTSKHTLPLPLPPQASGSRPILGHLHLMAGGGSSSSPPHFNLGALADRHGPIFTIHLGVRRVLVVTTSKLAKELFTVCDVAISSRPKTRAIKHLTYNFAMFGFSPYGAYWRHIRKLVTVELLSSRRIELYSKVCAAEMALSFKEMYALWEEKKDGSDRVLVDMKNWFGDFSLAVILKMAVGKRLCGGESAEEMRDVIREFFHSIGMLVVADALPWLGWLDLGGHEKRMKETAKKLDRIVGDWVEEHRRKGDSGGEGETGDFLEQLLSMVEGSDGFGDEYAVDIVIKSTCHVNI